MARSFIGMYKAKGEYSSTFWIWTKVYNDKEGKCASKQGGA